jgi:oligoribonuclease NrnB/cAMP/cGMP phosphodiesterase (DHH superfamily)
MSKTLIYFHSADFDGMGSAYIARKYALEQNPSENVMLIPINYGQPFPMEVIEPMDTTIMVDFSVTPELLMQIKQNCLRFIWIDHHITSLNDWTEYAEKHNIGDDYIQGLRTDGISGIELTYSFFYGFAKPRVVELLGRYDVWDKDHPEWDSHIMPFQFGLKMIDMSPLNDAALLRWHNLIEGDDSFIQSQIDFHILRGATCIEYIKSVNTWYNKKYGWEVKLHLEGATPEQEEILNVSCYATNTGMKSSMSFDNFIVDDKYDVYCAYAHTPYGIEFSVYSANGKVNVSKIAKVFGGGGHAGAAGFVLQHLPFKNIMVK